MTEKEKKRRKGGRKGGRMVTIIGKITATVPSFRSSRDRNSLVFCRVFSQNG